MNDRFQVIIEQAEAEIERARIGIRKLQALREATLHILSVHEEGLKTLRATEECFSISKRNALQARERQKDD